MAFRNRGNKASIILSYFSLFCLGRVLYSLFLSLFFFFKRFIFRLVIEGWQDAGKLGGISESASGVKLQSFSGKMKPWEPRNLHEQWCLSEAESRSWVLTDLAIELNTGRLCAIGRSFCRNDEKSDMSSLGHKCMWEQKGRMCFKGKKKSILICFNRKLFKKFLIKVVNAVSPTVLWMGPLSLTRCSWHGVRY